MDKTRFVKSGKSIILSDSNKVYTVKNLALLAKDYFALFGHTADFAILSHKDKKINTLHLENTIPSCYIVGNGQETVKIKKSLF